jgi:hypothetical protein
MAGIAVVGCVFGAMAAHTSGHGNICFLKKPIARRHLPVTLLAGNASIQMSFMTEEYE